MSLDKRENVIKVNDSENEDSFPIPGYSSIEEFTKNGYKSLMEAIRNSNALPNGRDYNFYDAHDTFKKIITNESNNVQTIINTILRGCEVGGNIKNRSVQEKTELIVEGNDSILERVANNIDEMNGIRKTTNEPIVIQTVSAQLPINGSWNRLNNATFSVSSSLSSSVPGKKTGLNAITLLTAKNIVRPQSFFKDKIINSCKYPWEPRITEKPNSIKPLAIFLEETENGQEYSHPYECELDKFTPSSEQLQKEAIVEPKPLSETPLIEVTEPKHLQDLLNHLQNQKIFAVDLEHHSYRSFMGITCLMQISTSENDYLIDTLALRDKLWILNEVFTKPSIVKVFHGADMDIKWLQRDLSIYVVNMFDTHQACKLLELSGLSLSYLMQRYCKLTPNKQFQLADWRIRPLPEELKSYAREDTHYLLYIYQNLKKELIDKANGQDNLIRAVMQRSTEVCKKRYFRPVLTEESHMDFYRKSKRMFDNRQLYALKELFKWRDTISREEDESTGYVLPNHMLLQISESLPREMQGILACCNPIPPLVRSNLLELHSVVLKARDQSLEKPILQDDTRARGSNKTMSKINIDSPLNCPHDLTKSNEFRDDLPTILKGNLNLPLFTTLANEIEKKSSAYSVFDTPESSDNEAEVDKKLKDIKFLGPFERYKLVKPFIQAEEEKLAKERLENTNNDNKVEDKRTDEDRIESIREHFLNLTKKNVEEKSLVEMGGSKKRKREPSEDRRTMHPEHHLPDNQLHTPIPNLNHQENNRKRKSSEYNEDIPDKLFKIDNNPDHSLLHQGAEKSDKYHFERNRDSNRNSRGKMPHHQNRRSNEHNRNYDQMEGEEKNKNRGQNDRNRGRNDRNRGHNDRNRGHNDRNRGQNDRNRSQNRGRHEKGQNESFESFDYSGVDFRQFQGGASSAVQKQEYKSDFRNRGNKNKRASNKSFNKSQTFRGSSRGGRGR